MSSTEKITVLPGKTDVGLFLSGSAAQKNMLYTKADLEAFPKGERKLFSVYDDHAEKESRHIEEGTGLPLAFFFEDAKATGVEEVKIRSVDGFESVISELRSRRYYFPGLPDGDDSERERREPLVSFRKNGERVKYFPHPTVMFGQQGPEDKNKDFFAKGVRYLMVGSRDRAFWAKGDRLAHSRYFGIDQIFAFHKDGEDALELLEIAGARASGRESCTVPGIRLGERFWKEELGISDIPEGGLFAISGSGEEFPVSAEAENRLFFTGSDLKRVGFWDGEHILEDFAGIRVGEIRSGGDPKEVRIPSEKAEGDFYIHVVGGQGEISRYVYAAEELADRFGDLLSQEEYCFYNHNMDGGRGGMRKVTGRGWKITDLLALLPEIPDREFIDSGGVLFRIFTRDSYKEKLAADGNELGVYRFLLTFEQDQRTETGMEESDTSAWGDAALHFAPIRGNTPFRVYCGKGSANPAVYKNVEGIRITLC